MGKREVLQNLYLLELDIHSQQEMIARLENLAAGVRSQLAGNTGGGSGGSGSHSYTENIIVRMIELKEKVSKRTATLLQLQQEVLTAIDNIPDEVYRITLIEHFLNNKSLEVIGSNMGYSSTYMIKIRIEALEHLRIPQQTYKRLTKILKEH